MDKQELNQAVIPFIEECARTGYPIQRYNLREAYLGDSSTSFFIDVQVDWMEPMSYFEAVSILIDVMWETMSVETRKSVFAIKIFRMSDPFPEKPHRLRMGYEPAFA